MMNLNWKLAALAGLGLSFGYGQAADASLLVYEGFNYGAAGADQEFNTASPDYNLLDGQADGNGGDVAPTGLSSTWEDQTSISTGQHFLSPGSLSFGDLATTGNHIRSDTNSNNDVHVNTISANLDTSGTTGELWFSFLASKLKNNFSAAEGGVAITNQNLTSSRVLLNAGSGLEGFGIAPTTSGNNWTGYAWNGTTMVDVGGTYGVPTNGSQTDLLIGKISLGTGTAGADEYSVYYYTLNAGSIAGGTLTQIGSTIEVDVAEADLDTLNVTRQVNTAYDEIRIADNLDEALGVPEPSSLALLGLGGLLIARRRRG